MARRFKAIPMTELAQIIPEWKDLGKAALKSPHDVEILAKMFETLDRYAEQNGMQLFQVHYRRVDNTPIAIFTLKD